MGTELKKLRTLPGACDPGEADFCGAMTVRGEQCQAEPQTMFGCVPLCNRHDEAMQRAFAVRARQALVIEAEELSAEIATLTATKRRLSKAVSHLERRKRELAQWLILRLPLSTAKRAAIIERDNYSCFYCLQVGTPTRGPDGRVWHIDHVVPVTLGGTNKDENLVLACGPCNLAKHDKTLDEFAAELARSM